MKRYNSAEMKKAYESAGFRERYAMEHGNRTTVYINGHKCYKYTYSNAKNIRTRTVQHMTPYADRGSIERGQNAMKYVYRYFVYTNNLCNGYAKVSDAYRIQRTALVNAHVKDTVRMTVPDHLLHCVQLTALLKLFLYFFKLIQCIEEELLHFLMDHYFIGHDVWLCMDRHFSFLERKEELLGIITKYNSQFEFDSIIPLSAKTGTAAGCACRFQRMMMETTISSSSSASSARGEAYAVLSPV